MANSQLILDSFEFEGLEIPDKLVIKNKQRFVVHHTGRGCMMDSLGEDCQSIGFRGTFTGSEAANRSKEIDLLRAQGMPLRLTWQSQTMFVLIKEFELSHKSVQWIDYRILCLVVQASLATNAVSEDILAVSLTSQVGDALTLLQSVGMNSTPSQTAALNTLARMNYDTASESDARVAKQLLTSIDQALVNLDGALMTTTGEQKQPMNLLAQSMSRWVDSIGKRSTLTLARNRLLDIMVNLENINK